MPGLFDNDEVIPDEDYINDESDEELGVDYMAMDDTPEENDNEVSNNSSVRRVRKRRVKIKPMPKGLQRRFSGVVTLLITRDDGSQVLLVNPAK